MPIKVLEFSRVRLKPVPCTMLILFSTPPIVILGMLCIYKIKLIFMWVTHVKLYYCVTMHFYTLIYHIKYTIKQRLSIITLY